jgi:hypothetical protein
MRFKHVGREAALTDVVFAAVGADVFTILMVDNDHVVPFLLQGDEGLRAQETPEGKFYLEVGQ